MFYTDSGIWRKIAEFARSLGNTEDFISKARKDFNELLKQYAETCESISSKYTAKELENSLSMQNFYPWVAHGRFLCLYELVLSGFRHTALRELRSYLELSARAYYIDTEFNNKTYEVKVKLLNIFKPEEAKTEDLKSLRAILCPKEYEKATKKRLGFSGLLKDLPNKKRDELKNLYSELCDYVHLSEKAQTDALGDFGLDLALGHREYDEDRKMFQKTFTHSKYLLLRTLEKKQPMQDGFHMKRCQD